MSNEQDPQSLQQHQLRRLDHCIAIAQANLRFLEKARSQCLAGDFEGSLGTLRQQENYLLAEHAESLAKPDALLDLGSGL